MKDIKLVKGKDNWIYISSDGVEETAKLLYDDNNTYGTNNNTVIDKFKLDFTNMAVKNNLAWAKNLMWTEYYGYFDNK